MGEQNLRGEQDLQEIIDSNGFRHVATAIRRSTVSLQRKKVRVKQGKAQPDEIAYEIRYGLGTDLSRSAATNKRDVFIQALTEFLSKYSAESARVYERTDGRQDRAFVSTSDLEEVVKLVDKFGAKTVCSLLVAYGYASDWKGKSEEDDTTEQITEEADNE